MLIDPQRLWQSHDAEEGILHSVIQQIFLNTYSVLEDRVTAANKNRQFLALREKQYLSTDLYGIIYSIIYLPHLQFWGKNSPL